MLKPIILKNGLTVLRIPKAGLNSFLVGFVCQTGSSIEQGNFPQGISRFIERLFWCGTDRHSTTRKLNLALENIGGDYTSMTSQEFMQFYITVPSYNQNAGLSLLAEVIQTSVFDDQDIKREQKLVIENLRSFNEEAEFDSNTLLTNNLYVDSSLGLPIQGTVDSITDITQGDILEYLHAQIRPERSYLVIAGNFDSKNIIDQIINDWEIWKPKPKQSIELENFKPADVGELPRIVYYQRGFAETLMTVGFLLSEGSRPTELVEFEEKQKKAELNDEDFDQTLDFDKLTKQTLNRWAILMVMNSLLGQGLSSRLWLKCVEEELLFTKISSEVVKFATTGYLQISGLIDNSQFSFGLQSIFSVLEALKKTSCSINEIAKAKQYLKGRLIMEHEDLLNSSLWQVEAVVSSGLIFNLQDLINEIDKVDVNEIRDIAQEIFSPDRLVISTSGTARERGIVDKLIKKYLE